MPQLCTFGAAAARGFGLTEESAQLPDDDFNLTTLLLPGNGTNGAQNNTFLDSSTNNFTVTRNGNTTQGTFSPFSFGGGTAPADGYYSGYFDGTGDSLSISSSTAFNFGTGNFTIQGWVYMFAYTAGGTGPAFFGTTNGALTGYFINLGGDVNGLRVTSNASGSWADNITVSTGNGVSLNQWTHIALVRNGASLTLYKNGVNVASTSSASSWNFSSPNNAGYIGRVNNGSSTQELTGYISNLKVSNVAESISVPTTPLTSDGNTRLLTCQSSQFIDNSTNALAITGNGNSQPTVVNPFGMTDWSGYFDGTGDYLSIANNAAFLLATNNFTIEFWVYPTNVSSTQSILSKGAGGYSPFLIQNSSGSGLIYISSAGSAWDVASGVSLGTIPISTWTHIAITREGNTFKTFKNGIQVSTFSSSASLYNPANPVTIGYNGGGYPEAFYGNISNLRIVNGTALYTANFTPPTAPLTAVTNTTLLTCQSSTFVDNSPNAFTITANGSAYTGTLNNPFNSPVNYTTPPLQAWSNYFDGTGDYLSIPTSNVLMHQIGNWTYEGWIFWNVMPSTGYQNIFGQGTGGQNSFGLTAYNGSTWSAPYKFVVNQANIGNRITGTTTLVAGTWYHFAVVRNNGVITLYVNGTAEGTYSNSTDYTFGGNPLTIGDSSNGYISNFRFNRSAVYTSAFTPSTVPLTAIANTSLLTCQSNRFIDNSINAFAITVSGNTSVQPFSPFNPTAAYSAGTVGGSGYFDGTGDDLTTPSNAAFTYGTGDFTIEGFYFFTGGVGPSGYSYLFAQGGGTGITSLGVYIQDGVYRVWNGSAVIVGTTAYAQNRWVHIALARSGTTLRLFVNGVLDGSATNSNSIASGSTIGISIGRWVEIGDLNWITGYVSNFRIVKGTALYTANFTVPTTPLTNITNTSLLLNYTNGGIIDATAKNVLETVGNAQISTAQSKFGGSSMSFDGSGDYLIGSSQLFAVGSGNFTLEAWVYLNANPATEAGIISSFNTGGGTTGFYLGINSTGRPFNTVGNGNIVNNTVTATSALTLSTWTHIAGVRVNGTLYLYVNGVSTGTPISNTGSVDRVLFGLGLSYPNSPQAYLNGYVDDARVSRFARYTTNFTPPTQAFPLF